jgi:hypothetical protein
LGVRILEGSEIGDGVCLYCSVTMWAFGPIFEDRDEAQQFLDWGFPEGSRDPRDLSDGEMRLKWEDFCELKQKLAPGAGAEPKRPDLKEVG